MEHIHIALQKVNAPMPNASFRSENQTGATGVVLRDHEGRWCGAWAKRYEHCLNALTTEAMACRDGMQYALKRGVEYLQLETDCKVLVSLWEKSTFQNSEIGPLLQQINDLSRSFVEFDLFFSNRSCNRLAHECVKLVSCTRSVEEWLIPPLALQEIMYADCNHVHDT